MTTFYDKHHRPFPLVPSDCDCAKLGEYFGKLRNAKITALQTQGDSGERLGLGKLRKENRRLMSKMGISKANVSDVGDTRFEILSWKWRYPFRYARDPKTM